MSPLPHYRPQNLSLGSLENEILNLLKDGSLIVVGTPDTVITPEVIAEVFGVDVAIIDTPVGLQICPLAGTK